MGDCLENYKSNEVTSSAKRTDKLCIMLTCKQKFVCFFSFDGCR